MTDASLYLALVAKALENNDAINGMVDGHISTGAKRGLASPGGSHHCAIELRTLSKTSENLGGSAYHGIADHSHLIEIGVVCQGNSDTYAWKVMGAIEDLFKAPVTVTFNSVEYSFSLSKFKVVPIQVPELPKQFYVIATAEANYLG